MKNLISLNWRSKLEGMENVNFLNDDYYIYRNEKVEPHTGPFKMDMTICGICLKGESKGRVDMIPFEIKAPAISIVLPGQIIEHEYCSDDFEGIYILMSERFNEGLNLPDRFSNFLSVRNKPVVSLTDKQLDAMLTYCKMVQNVIKVTDNPNRMEIIRHLTIAFFYGLGYYFYKLPDGVKETRSEVLMRNFLKQVQAFHKQERKVEFYADRLCLSPKYLSQTIKSCSGKTAGEWIDEYVALEAKALLRSTNMTIQQIGDELNFPSQSFFGKYFKRLTGMSPKAYRE